MAAIFSKPTTASMAVFVETSKLPIRDFFLVEIPFERRTAFHLAMFEGLCWEPSSYKIHSKSYSQMLQLAKIIKTSDIAAVVVKLTAQIALKSLVMQNGVIPMTFTSFQRWKGTAATMWQLLATQSAKVQKCKLKSKKTWQWNIFRLHWLHRAMSYDIPILLGAMLSC